MKIKCPACAKVLSIPETAAGKVVKCPCGKQLRVPGAAASPAPVPPNPAASQPSASPLGTDASLFDELTDQDLQPVKSAANPYASSKPAAPSGSDPLKGYAPPSSAGQAAPLGNRSLATVGQRLGGALVDYIFGLVVVIGGLIIFGLVMGAVQFDPDNIGAGMNIMLISVVYGTFLLPTFINAYLISVSGQSVGKKIVKTRIVDQATGTQSGFVQGFLVRNFVFGIILNIPCIGIIVFVADLIMLFPEPHETVHDKLAKTMVVQA